MATFKEMIENITPEIHQNLRLAIELGKFPDGRRLTDEQKELIMEALIAWEAQNLPEEERIGYMGEQGCKSGSSSLQVPEILFKSSDTLH